MNYFLFNVSLNLTTTMPPGEWILTNLLNTTAQSYEMSRNIYQIVTQTFI